MEKKTSLYSEAAQSEQWGQSIVASMQKETGKTLEEWVAIARTCPVQGRAKQLAWFKSEHGLLQNRAMTVLFEAFPEEYAMRHDPEALVDDLFAKYPQLLPVYHTVLMFGLGLPGVVASPRKTYVPLVAKRQFAVLLPHKSGLILGLGLAQAPDSPRLVPAKNLGAADRIKHQVFLNSEADFDAEVQGWLTQAWQEGQ